MRWNTRLPVTFAIPMAGMALLVLAVTAGMMTATGHGLESPPGSTPMDPLVAGGTGEPGYPREPTLPLGEPCRPARFVGRPLDPGGPLHGSGIESMTPTDIDATLAATGYCYSYRLVHQYRTDYSEGYSEIWCAPPLGSFESALFDPSGTIVVFIRDHVLQTPRPQPAVGWYCLR